MCVAAVSFHECTRQSARSLRCAAEERLRSAAREAAKAFGGGAATVFFDEGASAAEKQSAGMADCQTLLW